MNYPETLISETPEQSFLERFTDTVNDYVLAKGNRSASFCSIGMGLGLIIEGAEITPETATALILYDPDCRAGITSLYRLKELTRYKENNSILFYMYKAKQGWELNTKYLSKEIDTKDLPQFVADKRWF